ncbi:hypothetical protein BGZ74_007942, partial [Mortierella antarctica]
RWQQHQDRLLQQHQATPPRFLPARIRQRMSRTQTRHCWQALEFCRFYVTILTAISLMGAVVYGALHVEHGERGHGRSPRADVVKPVYRPEVQIVDASAGSGGVLGGGGGVQLGQNVLMVDPVPPSGLRKRPAGSRNVPSAGGIGDAERASLHSRKPLAK